jgi:hypothetical protein
LVPVRFRVDEGMRISNGRYAPVFAPIGRPFIQNRAR